MVPHLQLWVFYELLRLHNILLLSLFAWATSFEKSSKLPAINISINNMLCEERNNLEEYHEIKS